MTLGPLVYRRLAISISLTVVIIVFLIVSVASMPILEAWISFAQVHVDITEINIVQVPSLISTLKRTWWGIFAVSIVYLVLLVTLGEETRDMYKWIVKRLTKLRRRKAKPPLPLYLLDKVNSSRSQSPPQTVELKSGWDDMPEFSPASRSFFRSALRMSKPKHAQAPSSPSSNATIRTLSPLITSMDQSPNPSLQSIASVDKDNAFMSNTLRYLESPTARSLGISPPSPVYGLLMRGTEHTTPAIESGRIPLNPILDKRQSISSAGNTSQATGLTPTGTKKEIGNSTISSVFDAAWPLPPVAPVTPSSRYTTLQ
ncbi:hypothetical protein BDQ17DRAFT_1423203 [Cyathus striatus]|nr:hypothetical protein BDQ17DRAFT_1423203 [Cyathus striatus]